MTIDEIEALIRRMSPEQREDAVRLVHSAGIWTPLPGPQTMAYISDADIVGYGGSAGGGKGLALDTPIPTPSGWVLMGDIKPDDVVFDENGNQCRVIGVSEINNRCCYKLIFDDGASIIADDVHRWVTFDAKELANLTKRDADWKASRRLKRTSTAKGIKSAAFTAAISARNSARAEKMETLPLPIGTIRSTQEIYDSQKTTTGRSNHAIKMQGALNTAPAILPIPPYTLGAWLGDGTSINGGFTGIDSSIWERIESDGFEVRHSKKINSLHTIVGLKVRLRPMGLLGNKHIPDQYLRASYEQRLELLQGLMDTDGHAATDGGAEFDNINEKLADGVFELCRSLGIKATKQNGTAKLNGREISKKYRIKFTTILPVFGMPRKAQRLPLVTRRVSQFRYLISCEKIDSVPTKCISVNSTNNMYLAGNAMIPTHNSFLAIGKALTQHQKSIIFRREGTQLTGIIDDMIKVVGHRVGYNSIDKIWRNPVVGKQVEFGSFPNLGDETRYQGRPHDLIVFDEAANMRESQVRFLMGWLRTTLIGQKCQALMTFNPPTDEDGRWIISFFAPWLDRTAFPAPALAGELRYAASIPAENGTSKDLWVDGPAPFVLHDGEPLYDFDTRQYRAQDIITPMSRTFIPSSVSDNPFLVGTGYIAQLQALPEPLRSQMLHGDFMAGVTDDPWQVIPTDWVDRAMDRWTDRYPKGDMDSLGCDVARGGKDETVIARRHGMWFDKPLVYAGQQTPDGPAVAGLCISALRDQAPIHIDVIGVGSSPYDFLVQAQQQVLGVNVSEKSVQTDRSGRLKFFNVRTELWWMMREALDPAYDNGICLPPNKRLKADLCTPRWAMKDSGTIQVESREAIVKRLGRSPDYASAYVLALIDTPKVLSQKIIAFYNRKTSWR